MTTNRCTVCSKFIGIFDVVFLSVGATQDYASKDIVDLSGTSVLFDLSWEGTATHQGCGYNVVADTEDDGQCTFQFCSTVCLRRFLNSCVDELENKIHAQKNKDIGGGTHIRPLSNTKNP